MAKQKVFLTGATGSMGGEALKEMLRRRDKYDTVILARPSKVNREKLKKYEGTPGLSVVWGDLTVPADVEKAVEGVDAVLHPAAFIAPAADHNPPMARKCNYEGTVNIINAIKKQPGGAERIKLVSVGTVAEYGDRLPPIHYTRVGDPLKPSVGDFYAVTKMAAERAVMESGLKYWASIRQTYIAIPEPWTLMDPILYHQPPQTAIELVTSADAGYGIVQALETPDDFWGRVYNMGGGPQCRFVYSEYMERSFPLFGLGHFSKIMDRNWFGLRNFHCCWFEDSTVLNDYLGHWRHSYEDHLAEVERNVPWYMKLGGKIGPAPIVKMYMKRLADPLHWIQNGETEKIKAFFGSREAWANIGTWDKLQRPRGIRRPAEPGAAVRRPR